MFRKLTSEEAARLECKRLYNLNRYRALIDQHGLCAAGTGAELVLEAYEHSSWVRQALQRALGERGLHAQYVQVPDETTGAPRLFALISNRAT